MTLLNQSLWKEADDQYNDNADDDNVYLASFDNTNVAWLQVVPAISDVAWFTVIPVW